MARKVGALRVLCRAPAASFIATIVLVAVTLAVWPGTASAHAMLTSTTPAQNATLDAAPESVRLDFNEPVEVNSEGIKVITSDGRRVDQRKVRHVAGTTSAVEAPLTPRLAAGLYTVSYRIVSADGHPIAGGFTFSVGAAPAPAVPNSMPAVGASVASASVASPSVEGAFGVARGFQYLSLMVLIGACCFVVLQRRSGAQRRWSHRLLFVAAVTGLVASLLGFVMQGLLAAGSDFSRVVAPATFDASLGSRAGQAWLVRSLAWLAVLGVSVRRSAPGGRRLGSLFALATLLTLTLSLGGHAGTHSPSWLLVPSDFVHVGAAGAWLGSLVWLAVVYWPRIEEPVSAETARATARFSRMALVSMGVLIVAGTAQAWFYLGSFGAFISSDYGLALLTKIVVLLVILVLAAGNRRRTHRLLDRRRGGRSLRKVIRAEIALAVVVLAATAVMVRMAPPATEVSTTAAASTSASASSDAGPLRAELRLTPSRVGANDIELRVVERTAGAPAASVQEVTLALQQRRAGVGPVTVPLTQVDASLYRAAAVQLGVSGDWEAAVVIRVSEFDEYSSTLRFVVGS